MQRQEKTSKRHTAGGFAFCLCDSAEKCAFPRGRESNNGNAGISVLDNFETALGGVAARFRPIKGFAAETGKLCF